ncbi:MAG: hypothetical protein RJA52_1508, partial [Bacteroidota bacterium]
MSFLILMSFFLPSDSIKVRVYIEGKPQELAYIVINELNYQGLTDSLGEIIIKGVPEGQYEVEASYVGFYAQKKQWVSGRVLNFNLKPILLEQVVVTGTMREIRKSQSPIPVDVISSQLFQRNPTFNILESVSMITGVQPVMSCNVCLTGNIQINGMDGAYSQILIDGMPIVSGLGTVYGLSGIPNHLIERIEIVKGPGAALFGSEAMAGQINIITKDPSKVSRFSFDAMMTSWSELNLDLGIKLNKGKKISGWMGINGFLFNQIIDYNKDGFTDVPIQQRISLFNRWKLDRFELAGRYFYENRWGGQTVWKPSDKGGSETYGESILTSRVEFISKAQPFKNLPLYFQTSWNTHFQDSYYGQTPFRGGQTIGFIQGYYQKKVQGHHLLGGFSYRYNHFDDNTPISVSSLVTHLPGLFLQDEWEIKNSWNILTGMRLDYHPDHRFIFSPRIAFKKEISHHHSLRMSMGKGFRVIQLFTEDHAALSGSRELVIEEKLNPEESWSFNLNYHGEKSSSRNFLDWDASIFYTVFSNKIWPDYDTNPNQIIYANSTENAVTRGVSIQMNYSDGRPLRANMGVTWMDVFQRQENGEKFIPIRAPRWSGVFGINYETTQKNWQFDLTGNWFGPQRLAVVENDFRPEYSPWYGILNLQIT